MLFCTAAHRATLITKKSACSFVVRAHECAVTIQAAHFVLAAPGYLQTFDELPTPKLVRSLLLATFADSQIYLLPGGTLRFVPMIRRENVSENHISWPTLRFSYPLLQQTITVANMILPEKVDTSNFVTADQLVDSYTNDFLDGRAVCVWAANERSENLRDNLYLVCADLNWDGEKVQLRRCWPLTAITAGVTYTEANVAFAGSANDFLVVALAAHNSTGEFQLWATTANGQKSYLTYLPKPRSDPHLFFAQDNYWLTYMTDEGAAPERLVVVRGQTIDTLQVIWRSRLRPERADYPHLAVTKNILYLTAQFFDKNNSISFFLLRLDLLSGMEQIVEIPASQYATPDLVVLSANEVCVTAVDFPSATRHGLSLVLLYFCLLQEQLQLVRRSTIADLALTLETPTNCRFSRRRPVLPNPANNLAYDGVRSILYCVMTDIWPRYSQNMVIYLLASADRGQNFSSPFLLAARRSGNRGYPSISFDPRSRSLLVSWYDVAENFPHTCMSYVLTVLSPEVLATL